MNFDKTALDKLFGTAPNTQPSEPAIQEDAQPIPAKTLPLAVLDPFAGQPFKAYTQDKLAMLADSIKTHGLLVPPIVRPMDNGRYQIIDGYNRISAMQQLEYTECEVRIEPMDDDQAMIRMIEVNLQQRQSLLPSEKAWAYKMKYDAVKRKAGRPDKNSPQNAANIRSDDQLAESFGISGDTLQRYIRLTYLNGELLQAVDERKLLFGVGIALSYLSEAAQKLIADYLLTEKKENISIALAEDLRAAAQKQPLTVDVIDALTQKYSFAKPKSIAIPYKKISSFFPDMISKTDMQKTIIAALEQYFKEQG